MFDFLKPTRIKLIVSSILGLILSGFSTILLYLYKKFSCPVFPTAPSSGEAITAVVTPCTQNLAYYDYLHLMLFSMIPFTFSYFFISFIWHLYAVYKENRTLSSRLIVVNTLFSIFGYFLIVYSLSGGQLSFFRLSSHLFNFIKSLIFENHFYHLQSVEYFGLIFFGFLIFLPLVIYIVGKFSSVGGGRTQISSVDVAMPPREVIGNYLREITIKNFFVYLLWFLAVCLAVGISYLGCVVLPLWTQFCLGSSLNNIVLSVLQIFIIALFATIPISFILRLVDDSFFLKLYIKTTVLIVLIMFISLFISYEIGLLPRHNFYGGISVPVVPGISY